MKKTKKEFLTELLNLSEVAQNPELVDFLKKEIALLDKKTINRSQKSNAEHETIMSEIKTVLVNSGNVGLTISEMQNQSELLSTLSNQKVSAMLKKLVDSGVAYKKKDKKTTKFFLVA